MDTWRKATTRKSLPLTARDLEDLAKMRSSATYRGTLGQLADVEVHPESSEAAVLHAVWEAGVRAVQERVEAEGYAQIAAEMDAAQRKAVARRRRPSWADDA